MGDLVGKINMVSIENIVSCIATDKVLLAERDAVRDLPECLNFLQDEVVDLFLDLVPTTYRDLSQLIMLAKERNDIILTYDPSNDESSSLASVLSDSELMDYCGYSVESAPGKLRLSNDCREIKYDFHSQKVSGDLPSLHHSLGSTLTSNNFDSGRETLRAIIDSGAKLSLVGVTSQERRKLLHQLEQGFGRKYFNDLICDIQTFRNVSLSSTRAEISIPLDPYTHTNSVPTKFNLSQNLLSSIDHKDQTSVKGQLNTVIDFKNPNSDEASLIAHLYINRQVYRYVGKCLNSVKNLPLRAELEQRFDDQVKEKKDYLLSVLSSVLGEEHSLDNVASALQNDWYLVNHLQKSSNEYGSTQGILGEVIGISIMKKVATRLKELGHQPPNVQSNLYGEGLYVGTPGKKLNIKRCKTTVRFGETGYNLYLFNHKLQRQQEIDGLLVYGGVPVIFEVKTGSCRETERKRKLKEGFIQNLYGVSALFVEIYITEDNFLHQEGERYVRHLPHFSNLSVLEEKMRNLDIS